MTQERDGTKAVPERLARRLAEVAAEFRREIYGGGLSEVGDEVRRN